MSPKGVRVDYRQFPSRMQAKNVKKCVFFANWSKRKEINAVLGSKDAASTRAGNTAAGYGGEAMQD